MLARRPRYGGGGSPGRSAVARFTGSPGRAPAADRGCPVSGGRACSRGAYAPRVADSDANARALADLAAGLVGMPKDQARQICAGVGLHLRLVDWDELTGPVALTSDYRADRITAEARAGVVTQAEAG